ncbi:hypothetical protein [Aquimarina sp. 2304DJ70-9]|uniref:hypothetical protein n=1 Tax=Aquimarina penaris TaxID=3231044 RepID=UPI0034624AE9
MKELERLIRLSYGNSNLIFAGHTIEMEYAAESIVRANNDKVGMQQFITMHTTFLSGKGCSDEHINEQLERVRNINFYFTND